MQTRLRRRWAPLATIIAVALALVACSPAGDASPPPEPTPGQVPSPVPEAEMPHGFVEAILADAEQVTGRPRAEHRIERADPTNFTDQNLNCAVDPALGTAPPAAQIEGYTAIVMLEDETSGLQQRLDYRIRADDGSFLRCDTLPQDQLP
jgi:hypothetical protein